MSFYGKNYRESFLFVKGNGRILLGQMGSACRYCHESRPSQKGWREAHSIPMFLDNRELFSLDECSACNKMFGDEYDDSLSKFTKFYRSLLKIKSRKGVPSSRSKGISVDCDGERVNIRAHDSGSAVKEDDLIHLSYQTEAYSKLHAWKGLVKCGFSMLPEQRLPEFELTRLMLKNPKRRAPLEPCYLFMSSAPWGGLKHRLAAILFERKSSERSIVLPEMMLVLIVRGFFYHVPIFSDRQCEEIDQCGRPVKMSFPPITDEIPVLAKGERPPKLTSLDMTNPDKESDTQKVTLKWVDATSAEQ